jgi:hypothetical protein
MSKRTKLTIEQYSDGMITCSEMYLSIDEMNPEDLSQAIRYVESMERKASARR